MLLDRERRFLLEALREGSRLCREVERDGAIQDIWRKERGDPVTLADFSVQMLVQAKLAREFPEDAVVGEEDLPNLMTHMSGKALERALHYVEREEAGRSDLIVAATRSRTRAKAPERYWTIDPVDGTKGFQEGGQYAIAIGLVENGRVVMGCLACPRLPFDGFGAAGPLGVLFLATKGCGVTMMELQSVRRGLIRVDAATSCDFPITYCESADLDREHQLKHRAIASVLGIRSDPVRSHSQCKYCLVARGEVSLYLRSAVDGGREAVWDHAAGVLIVEEAGGCVTDFNGRRLEFLRPPFLSRAEGIVASNGVIHNRAVGAIAEVSEGRHRKF